MNESEEWTLENHECLPPGNGGTMFFYTSAQGNRDLKPQRDLRRQVLAKHAADAATHLEL
jgi:hypothetical protein